MSDQDELRELRDRIERQLCMFFDEGYDGHLLDAAQAIIDEFGLTGSKEQSVSSDYTPTVEEVRTDYVLAYADRDSSQLLAGAAFDHFINKVRADAWDEGYETGCSSPYGTATPSGKPYDPEPNPHRER